MIPEARSYSRIEREATAFRQWQKLQLKPADKLPACEIFEGLDDNLLALGGNNYHIQYSVEDMAYGEGRTQFNRDENCFEVVLSPDAYDDVHKGRGRGMLTFAHELAHLTLHPTLLYDRAHSPSVSALLRERDVSLPTYHDPEWQANAWGGAVLVPAAGLAELEDQGLLHPEEVAGQYGVSWSAARVRIDIYARRKAQLITKK